MDALGWERMTVVGHSMGGHNAMAFAAWHPERVSRLVIVDSRPAIPADRLDWMHARGRRAPRLHPHPHAAVRAFPLLPRRTLAAPGPLAPLARLGLVRGGRGGPRGGPCRPAPEERPDLDRLGERGHALALEGPVDHPEDPRGPLVPRGPLPARPAHVKGEQLFPPALNRHALVEGDDAAR